MSLVGNIIWLICGGLLSGLGYILGGIALCFTIIGIPFGIAHLKLVPVAFWPLGREIVDL